MDAVGLKKLVWNTLLAQRTGRWHHPQSWNLCAEVGKPRSSFGDFQGSHFWRHAFVIVFVWWYTRVYIYIYMYVYVHINIWLIDRLYTYTYHMHINIYLCTHVYSYMDVVSCLFVCVKGFYVNLAASTGWIPKCRFLTHETWNSTFDSCPCSDPLSWNYNVEVASKAG